MGTLFSPFISLFRFHKLKIITFLVAALFFIAMLFPFGDIGDLVTAQISQATQNQVYVSFERLDLAVVPQPGLKMTDVRLETSALPGVEMSQLFVSTSILGLITFRPGIAAIAEGLAGGNLAFSTRGGEYNKNGVRKQVLSLNAQKLNLEQVLEMLKANLQIKGSISAEGTSTVDFSFADQPEGQLELSTQDLNLDGAQIPTPMGAFPLPRVKISQIRLEGNLNQGRLIISRGEIGGSKSDVVSGTISGQVELRFNPSPSGVQLMPGGYNLAIKLKAKPEFEREAGLLLGFVERYKRSGSGFSDYAFRISSQNLQSPPSLAPL